MIPITQFVLPHGEQRQGQVDTPHEIDKLGWECINAGARFTVKILTTNELSLVCEYKGEDIVIKLVRGKDKVNTIFQQLVTEAVLCIREKLKPKKRRARRKDEYHINANKEK